MPLSIKKIPKDSTIRLFGIKIHGIEALKNAVEKSCYISFDKKPFIFSESPEKRIYGLHVALIKYAVPCFDEFDRAVGAYYSNFLISNKTISDEEIREFSNGKNFTDGNLVNDQMDPKFAPAVYFRGYIQDKMMILSTLKRRR